MKNLQNVEISVFNKNKILIKKFTMRKGGNLWVWLRKNNVSIGSACSGVGVCGACHVSLLDSPEESKENPFISEQTDFEKNTLSKNKKDPKHRLACLTRVYSNLSILADYW